MLFCDRAPISTPLGDLPSEEGRDGDEAGEDPDGEDHEHDSEGGALREVVDGLGDGPVAVQRDQADVHDGRRARQHVHRRVDVAPHLPEHPVACKVGEEGFILCIWDSTIWARNC